LSEVQKYVKFEQGKNPRGRVNLTARKKAQAEALSLTTEFAWALAEFSKFTP